MVVEAAVTQLEVEAAAAVMAACFEVLKLLLLAVGEV